MKQPCTAKCFINFHLFNHKIFEKYHNLKVTGFWGRKDLTDPPPPKWTFCMLKIFSLKWNIGVVVKGPERDFTIEKRRKVVAKWSPSGHLIVKHVSGSKVILKSSNENMIFLCNLFQYFPLSDFVLQMFCKLFPVSGYLLKMNDVVVLHIFQKTIHG